MALVSRHIRRMQIFVGLPLGGGGRQMAVQLSTTVIFGDLGGYFYGNITDNASNITWRYATACWPIIDCRMNDPE